MCVCLCEYINSLLIYNILIHRRRVCEYIFIFLFGNVPIPEGLCLVYLSATLHAA